MARFRATIYGQRGHASRLGSANSGIESNTNGWQSGVNVVGSVDIEGNDVFNIYATGGSGVSLSFYVGTVRIINGKVVFNREVDTI